MGPSQDLLKTLLFWPNFDHFGPLLRVLEEAAARPVQAAFGLEDLFGASQTHARTSNFGHLTTFPIEKVNFVILPIRGQWKCHFDPILSPPEPKPLALAKMCLFGPLPGWTLEGPSGTLNLTLIWPFWTLLRVLEEAAARPRTSCLWAGGPAQSLSNPCPGPQILVILTTFPIEKVNFCHFAYQGSVKMPFWPHFEPSWAQLFGPGQNVPIAPFDRMDLGGTLRDPKFDLKLTILDPFWGPGRLARPRTSCLLGWRTCSEPLKPMPGTSNFGHFDHFFFLLKKSIFFVIFAYRGQWKCHFDPILTPFWALLSPTFWPWQNVPIAPFDRMDLGGTLRDLNLT